jgi:hypothetical protein
MKPEPKVTAFSSPKQRFLASEKNIAAHQMLVDSSVCGMGLDVALAELAYELADKVQDPNGAMGAGFQLRGAVRFLKKFKELAELPKPVIPAEDPGELRPQPDKRRP